MDETAPQGASLYAKEERIHAREVQGSFQRLRKSAAWTLLGIYYLLPWLTWDGRQAVLFDLPARKFYIFGMTLWPQDFYLLSWLLIMAALALFLSTSVAGRVWCGYACPQTVWTEAFVWLQRITEGNFSQRRKLDKAPWGVEKLVRKGAKQVLWVSFAAWTGFTFVGFFSPIQELGMRVAAFELGPWETFWICFYSLATYGNAGHLREQVCKYMCPYARFQSAMFDRNTLIVSYDPRRGEPRGSRKRNADPARAGAWRLRGLQYLRPGLSHRDRHTGGPPVRMHHLRGVHRRLQFGHGQDGIPTRTYPVHDAKRAGGRGESGFPSSHADLQWFADGALRSLFVRLVQSQPAHTGCDSRPQCNLSGDFRRAYRERLYAETAEQVRRAA